MRMLKYFKNKFQMFIDPENIKKRTQKLLIIGPKLFSQARPGCPNQPRIDFSYHIMSGTSICSLICGGVMGLLAPSKWFLRLIAEKANSLFGVVSRWVNLGHFWTLRCIGGFSFPISSNCTGGDFPILVHSTTKFLTNFLENISF